VAYVADVGLVETRVGMLGVCLIQIAVKELLGALRVRGVLVELRRGSLLKLLIQVAQILHHLITVVVDVNIALVLSVLDQTKA
jgi:hypothetical protein